MAEKVQESTGSHDEIAFVDQGYTGDATSEAAAESGIELKVVKHAEPIRGFVLLPRRWVVERTIGWVG
ncbi:transposase [bacterium]|nr:transposase [bacterium]